MRTGDVVFHEPSGEEWLVAWADHDSGYMAPCGWPTCQAKISDCRLVKVGADEEATKLIEQIAKSGRSDAHIASRLALPQDPKVQS